MDFDGTNICGQLAAMEDIQFAKWPGTHPSISWHIDTEGYGGTLTVAEIYECFALAWKSWSDRVLLTTVRVESVAQAFVRKHFAMIDGPSGTLAWSMLADNTNNPKTQRYDAGDKWLFWKTEGRPTGGIDLLRVAIHEIGHVLGLPHDSRSADAIMRPMYSVDIPRPTDRDIDRLVALGYLRRTSPPTDETPDPPPVLPPVPPLAGRVVVDASNRAVYVPDGWRVERGVV